jgi:methylmalonyl-CoA mutase N-terminal domain/subunit
MAPILAAVNEYATLQEMMDVLRETWGVYAEPVIL